MWSLQTTPDWPKYVWVVHSLQPNELLLDSVFSQSISEGIFSFQLAPNEWDNETPTLTKSCWKYCEQNVVTSHSENPNPFAFLLHHLIWILTSAAYNRCAIPVDALCSEIVYIYQIFDGATISTGIYYGHFHSLTKFYINETFCYQNNPFPHEDHLYQKCSNRKTYLCQQKGWERSTN